MSELPVVLVVDDEPAVRYTLRAILEEEGDIEVREAADGALALTAIEAGDVQIVITDMLMPNVGGLQLLDALAEMADPPKAIMITAHGSERAAVDAMKRGALDYFAKPFDPEDVMRVVKRSLRSWRLERDNLQLSAELALSRTMVFRSKAMLELATLVQRIAPRDVTILLTGESGTGKELVARAIVQASGRASAPYVRFNCAALARELAEAELFGHARGAFTGAEHARRGLFREADGGTILLDEIGDLDLQVQASLLRVLQEREVRPVGEEHATPVDTRIVAATHRDLVAEVEAGRFRQDLLYRLNVVNIHIPPLRERPADIAPLAHHFCAQFTKRFGLADRRLASGLVERLTAATWPGNVRELEHTIERLVALSTGSVIDEDDVVKSADAERDITLKERLAAVERGLIVDEMTRCEGNHSKAARRLGISRPTLYEKLKRYGLK
jgi:two-component system, NtrC family, response regulator HydG